MDALNMPCEVLFFYLDIFSSVFVGKEFWCKCDFCKSCCQSLVLGKVLSGILLSQQEKEEEDLPQPTPPKRCILMFTKYAHNLTRLSRLDGVWY